jgi:hypothetical protein
VCTPYNCFDIKYNGVDIISSIYLTINSVYGRKISK